MREIGRLLGGLRGIFMKTFRFIDENVTIIWTDKIQIILESDDIRARFPDPTTPEQAAE